MPYWVCHDEVASFAICDPHDSPLPMLITKPYEALNEESRKEAHDRFTMIAPILPVIGNRHERGAAITQTATEYDVSEQTIRNYLWLYLATQDVASLAPKGQRQSKPLTHDEKNMRWALNRFFYTGRGKSLNSTYIMLLKERYCDSSGKLIDPHPSFYQFRYFYRKRKNLQNLYITRDGLKYYQRNKRPLLGDGTAAFASSVGTAMLDSTICDIYLIDDSGRLAGRPILTACIDAYSSLCCGYYLSWEGGVYSLRGLMANVISDKAAWCRQFGIVLSEEEWACNAMPAVLVTDRGNEYKSSTFEQLTELGVKIVNLPSYRPELKGRVEKFFDMIQTSYKEHLRGKGVIESDFQERGAHDYRLDACLTLREFETVILRCIQYYNSRRILKGFPMTQEMMDAGVKPYANAIWNWAIRQPGANMIPVDYDRLIMTLLPRTTGTFTRKGLVVNHLRYRNPAYTESYLRGGTTCVAYNPDDATAVWLVQSGQFVQFDLIESRYEGHSLQQVRESEAARLSHENAFRQELLQAKIDLAGHIEAIANNARQIERADIHSVKQTHQREQERIHMDFMTGGIEHD